MDDLKDFRQLGSKTPGHPEYGVTDGVELTTGPLGAGMASAVGFAIGEKHMAAEFNTKKHNIFDHYTYVLFGDGCFMEGVTSEALSLAGHLKLNKLICLYDDNNITIDGDTNLTLSEDVEMKFKSNGWNVMKCSGDDLEAVDKCIEEAKKSDKPTMIQCKTIIGLGLPNKQGTNKSHGEPPGVSELELMKKAYGVTEEFVVPEEVQKLYNEVTKKKIEEYDKWMKMYEEYKIENPELNADLERRLKRDVSAIEPLFKEVIPASATGEATRVSSGKIFLEIAKVLPEMIGGTADLGGSVKVVLPGTPFHLDPKGRNIHFGIREHAMGNICNALAIYGGMISYCSTFFVFSDYLRPTIRLAAISNYPSIYVFTHDSIGVGEDGPTHQPIEHLFAYRSMPDCTVIRPCDANEARFSWKSAIENTSGPTVLVYSRQNTCILDRTIYNSAEGALKGGYILKDYGTPEVIIIATGTEVDIAISAAEKLYNEEKIGVRVVSLPSWEIFEKHSEEYRESVLPRKMKARVSVEAGLTFGWERMIGTYGVAVGMTTFGTSGPAGVLFKHFGITPEGVVAAAKQSMQNVKDFQ